MNTTYREEIDRIHKMEWDKHPAELERYASDLYMTIQHKDREIARLRAQLSS